MRGGTLIRAVFVYVASPAAAVSLDSVLLLLCSSLLHPRSSRWVFFASDIFVPLSLLSSQFIRSFCHQSPPDYDPPWPTTPLCITPTASPSQIPPIPIECNRLLPASLLVLLLLSLALPTEVRLRINGPPTVPLRNNKHINIRSNYNNPRRWAVSRLARSLDTMQIPRPR